MDENPEPKNDLILPSDLIRTISLVRPEPNKRSRLRRNPMGSLADDFKTVLAYHNNAHATSPAIE